MGSWSEIAHTADLALRIEAHTLEDLFRAAALGMADLAGESNPNAPGTAVTIALDAGDVEALLIDWLNELLYLGHETQCLFLSFQFEALTMTQLRGSAVGFPVVQQKTYIKAATYHNLTVRHDQGQFVTEVVLDV